MAYGKCLTFYYVQFRLLLNTSPDEFYLSINDVKDAIIEVMGLNGTQYRKKITLQVIEEGSTYVRGILDANSKAEAQNYQKVFSSSYGRGDFIAGFEILSASFATNI